MKSIEFCYWLQGYFELSQEVGLTKKQLECISKHIALVEKHEGLDTFTSWLLGFLESYELMGGTDMRASSVQIIVDKLGKKFKHEIDKVYPHKVELNKIHNPDVPFDNKVYRC